MTFETIISVLGLLGLGGLLGNYYRILWERKNSALLQKQEFKETRYKCILLLMYSYLDFEKNKSFLNSHGYNMETKDDLHELLRTEWYNMYLFASNEMLIASHEFINNPSNESYQKVLFSMRQDLWGGAISPKVKNLSL